MAQLKLENSEINKLAGIAASTVKAYEHELKRETDPRERSRMQQRCTWWKCLNVKLVNALVADTE